MLLSNPIVRSVATESGAVCYEVSDSEMGPGASLANSGTWVNTGADGRISSVFSVEVGEEVMGPLLVRYGSGQARVAGCGTPSGQANVPLLPMRGGRFLIHAIYQKHSFDLGTGLAVDETVFVPRGQGVTGSDECVAYHLIEVRNLSAERRPLSVYAFVRLAGSRRTPVISGHYDVERGALFAAEEENPDWVRLVAATHSPASWTITNDFGQAYDTHFVAPFDGETSAVGDVLGCLEIRLDLEEGARERVAFTLGFTPNGQGAAEQLLGRIRGVDDVFQASVARTEEELSVCRIMTPDPVINEGVFWSKVNTLRVLAQYPEGESFTNEPGVSSNVVARDAVWFIYGCDHFRPESSRRLLEAFVRFQYPSGKIPEYYNARTGEVNDYGLNINDGTPLFVLGVNHHVRSTGDLEYLTSIYDSVARAARYIMSQRDERGLVFCDAEGVEVWGICSWRNVIPNYRINGAVTEVNAECAAALRAMGHMAQNVGRSDEAVEFAAAARELTDAINEHLLDRQRQLYLLNIDREGRRHSDATADELFPVLFRIADEDVAFRIIRRLDSPDFWTTSGLRTVSRQDPLYDPTRYVGLLGGVWPGLTWWYAFAAARYHPEFMVRALHASYEHYNRHPRVFNTVPGQFSEWFDGESLVNRGMRLSPWEPPRFLWAAAEGVCGIMLSPEEPGIRPLLPPDWQWVAAVGVCYHGASITCFAGREEEGLHVYANRDFRSSGPKDVLPEDVTGRVRAGHNGVHPVALSDGKRIVVALGSCREDALTTPVSMVRLLEERQKYRLRQYSSERGDWDQGQSGCGAELAELGVRIEARGYHILEFLKEA